MSRLTVIVRPIRTRVTKGSRLGIHSACMARPLTLRIVVEDPPPGVDYALQKGKGGAYQTDQKQRSVGKDLVFEFSPAVRGGVLSTDAAVTGPYIQGPRGRRFIYLDIGTYAGQADSCWSRKLKVPLDTLTAQMAGGGGVIEARVPGTGRDGGPSCATVQEFDGWKRVKC